MTMTLDDIKAMVIAVDPSAQHYDSTKKGPAYTVWREYGYLPMTADQRHQGGISFQIDRFTRAENDTIAAAFVAALESDDRIAYEYQVDYEPETRYIHHIFDCEAI